MKRGDRVEVNQVWAAQGYSRPPLRDWFTGYIFIRIEKKDGKNTIVCHSSGMYAGVRLRFPSRDVRPARE